MSITRDHHGKIENVTVQDVVQDVIDSAPDYHHGQLESVGAETNKVTEILGNLLALLVEKDIVLADELLALVGEDHPLSKYSTKYMKTPDGKYQ